MILIYIAAMLLIAIGLVLLFRLTPEQVAQDILRLVQPRYNTRDRAAEARGKKKKGKLARWLNEMQEALTTSGQGGRFAMICAAALVLCVAGIFAGILLDNIYIAPVLGFVGAALPFFNARSIIAAYNRHIDAEMETALSVITSSYARCENIIRAVEENISYIKPPLKEKFEAFLVEARYINADTTTALRHLREKVDNTIWREWCDTLIQCQRNRDMTDVLFLEVSRISDVRMINNEMATVLTEAKTAYYTMVALVVGNVPLIALMRQEWIHTLIATTQGKLALAIVSVLVLSTMMLMLKYTKPIRAE